MAGSLTLVGAAAAIVARRWWARWIAIPGVLLCQFPIALHALHAPALALVGWGWTAALLYLVFRQSAFLKRSEDPKEGDDTGAVLAQAVLTSGAVALLLSAYAAGIGVMSDPIGRFGIVTLLLVILVHRTESRTSVRFLSWIALGLVTFQAALGGFRVLLDRQLLAMIHGCTAPAFFAVATALAVVLSPKWNASHSKGNQKSSSTSLTMLALFTLLLIFLQIMIGANLRHITHWMTSAAFGAFVLFHLMIAAVVTGHVIWLYIRCRKQNSTIRRPASILAVLMIVQLALGTGSWIVQYSFPEFLLWIPGSSAYLVLAESFWQSTIVTAHVATGSLMLAAATMLSLRLISTEPDTWRWLQFTRMTPTAQLKWQGSSQ